MTLQCALHPHPQMMKLRGKLSREATNEARVRPLSAPGYYTVRTFTAHTARATLVRVAPSPPAAPGYSHGTRHTGTRHTGTSSALAARRSPGTHTAQHTQHATRATNNSFCARARRSFTLS